MASIIITLVTMLVISLIVLGFAAISRREQRQSLDQQLSAQAFYAAESAVEDAKKVIELALAAGKQPAAKERCDTNNAGGNYPVGQDTVLDLENDVSYTCLKVDVAPTVATYDGVGENGIVVPIKASGPIDRIEITWRPSTVPAAPRTPAECPGGTVDVFSPQPDWKCGYGLIRTDMVSSSGALTRAGIEGETMAGFFVPTNNGGSGPAAYTGGAGKPNISAADCDTVSYTQCKATITNLGSSPEFSLKIRSLYLTSSVSIIGYQGSTLLNFGGAQVVVDATGKAQDVLRRIQVRLPVKRAPVEMPPAYAIQSNNALCKRFTSSSTYFNIPGDIVNRDTAHPMCNPLTDGVPPPTTCSSVNDIVLTLDISHSMSATWETTTSIEKLKEVARRFMQDTKIGSATNHAGIVTFNQESEILLELTGDQGQLISTINTLSATGQTKYLEALENTVKLHKGPGARPSSPKVLIFVSDGVPHDDKDEIRASAAAMKDEGVRIYTVGITGGRYAPINNEEVPLEFDEQLLIDIAGGGGHYANADRPQDLDAIAESLSRDLQCP